MVTGKEAPRFIKTKDSLGTTWTLNSYSLETTNPIEVWSNKDDDFWIRQDNLGAVDLIHMDLGQAYDMIRALSEAIYNT